MFRFNLHFETIYNTLIGLDEWIYKITLQSDVLLQKMKEDRSKKKTTRKNTHMKQQ